MLEGQDLTIEEEYSDVRRGGYVPGLLLARLESGMADARWIESWCLRRSWP